jgi:hypothetical protein
LLFFRRRSSACPILHVKACGSTVIIKAAGPGNHHIGREITARSSYTRPLLTRGRVGGMLHASRSSNLLVLQYLDGELVERTEDELSPGIHAQAGELLRLIHSQETRVDEHYEARATAKAAGWLERKQRIAPAVEQQARERLRMYQPMPIRVVPTHGDWQPRKWISNNGKLRAIDSGRFDFRPAATDFCRLAVQQWQKKPALEEEFLNGYGDDARSVHVWRIGLLREGPGTAAFLGRVARSGGRAL